MDTAKLRWRLTNTTVPTPPAAPAIQGRIFSATSTLRRDVTLPDTVVSVLGSLSASAIYQVSWVGQTTSPLSAIAAADQRTDNGALLQLATSVPMEELSVWATYQDSSQQTITTKPVYINRATPWFTDSTRFSAGYEGILHGKNLHFGSTPTRIYLKDLSSSAVLEASVNYDKSREHSVYFTYPADCVAGRTYQIGVNNGLGGSVIYYLSKSVACIAGATDYFNLAQYGIPHRGIYNYGDYVIKISPPTDGTNPATVITAALSQAAAYTRPNGVKGGVVELQAGTWRYTRVDWLVDNVVMRWVSGAIDVCPDGDDTDTQQQAGWINMYNRKNCGLVNPPRKNTSTTSTAIPYSNLVAVGNTDCFIVGANLDLSESRWVELKNNPNLVVVGNTVNQGVARKANPAFRGPLLLDGCSNLIFRGNTVNYCVDCVSLLGCSNASIGGNTLNWNYDRGDTLPLPYAPHFFASGDSSQVVFYQDHDADAGGWQWLLQLR